MKKTFYTAVLLLFVGFQLSATMFTIINSAQSTREKTLGVDPYWSTNPTRILAFTTGWRKWEKKI